MQLVFDVVVERTRDVLVRLSQTRRRAKNLSAWLGPTNWYILADSWLSRTVAQGPGQTLVTDQAERHGLAKLLPLMCHTAIIMTHGWRLSGKWLRMTSWDHVLIISLLGLQVHHFYIRYITNLKRGISFLVMWFESFESCVFSTILSEEWLWHQSVLRLE